jgi:hypothetical protein
MVALQLLPVILSLIVLAAHFFRAGNLVLVVAILSVGGIAFVRRRWAARVAQSTLIFGALVWGHTLLRLTSERMQLGQPAARMAIILGTVLLMTLLSAWLLQVGALRRRYGIGQRDRP